MNEGKEVRGRWCKLTPSQVRMIRRLHFKGIEMANKYSIKSFAQRFNMAEGSIRDVVNRKNWWHLD